MRIGLIKSVNSKLNYEVLLKNIKTGHKDALLMKTRNAVPLHATHEFCYKLSMRHRQQDSYNKKQKPGL